MARKKSWPRSRTRAPRGAGDTRVLPEKTASSERKEVVGFGMTAEEITWYDVEGLKASLRDLRSQYKAGRNSFDIVVAPIEEWAQATLRGMGKRKAKHDPDSLASRACDYATQVLRRISFVRKAIADNNAQEAARFSVEVGQLSERIQAAIEWEHPALVGVGVAKRARNANDAKSAIRQSRIEKVAKSYNTFRTLNPKWLASMIDEHVRDALKIKEHTFQNYLAEARKQGRIPKRHRRAPR